MSEPTIDELLVQIMKNERAMADQIASLDVRIKRLSFRLERIENGGAP